MGEYKKAALCSAYKNKTPRPISREWKKERNLFRRADDDDEERRERRSRKGENSKRTFGNLDHNYSFLCVCVCSCVFKR